jgi:hypothetical protein
MPAAAAKRLRSAVDAPVAGSWTHAPMEHRFVRGCDCAADGRCASYPNDTEPTRLPLPARRPAIRGQLMPMRSLQRRLARPLSGASNSSIRYRAIGLRTMQPKVCSHRENVVIMAALAHGLSM